MAEKPVLILGVEPRITVPVARSLQRIGVPVGVASLSGHDSTLQSRAIFQFRRLPSSETSSADFVMALSGFIREYGFDMLIPTTDGALGAISEHYDRLKPLLHISCPPAEIIDRILNKEATLAIASQCGLRVPREYVISAQANLGDIPDLAYPVVAKPRQKSSAETFKVRYFQSEAELTAALKSGALDGAILQEYCAGDGVGVEMLFHQNECIAAFQHRRLKEVPHTGGAAAMAISEPVDPTLKKLAIDLLRGIGWEGVAMVEFRHDRKSGVASLMEVNGRYWGTVALALMAGVDFPAYEWQLAHGKTPSVPATYQVGLCWRWSAGMLKRSHGMMTGAKSTLPVASAQSGDQLQAGNSGPTRDALWLSSDPMPAVFELFRTGKTLVLQDGKALAKKLLTRRAVQSLKGRQNHH
jgi:predicted ATP-grasp superfamily ATP-dependent carboligase